MMNDGARFPQSAENVVPLAIIGGSVVLAGWAVLELVAVLALEPDIAPMPRYLVGYVTFVPSVLGLLWGGRWLRTSEIPEKHHFSIAMYWLGGGGGFLAFNAGIMAFYPPGSVWLAISWARWALSLGLVVGLSVGISQARSIYHALSAERQSLRATHLETQRDLVDHLNGILRHEVLNSTQAILGNVTLLQDEDEPIDPDDERLERIHRQGEELTQVITEVRTLLDTMQDDRELRPVDLTAVVYTEIRTLRDCYPEVDVDVTVPEAITVRADELLGRVFGNLLRNAVEHNDTESVRIEVTATVRDGTVVVRISDDGGGIPKHRLEGLFARPEGNDHGLGLYLVDQLVTAYDGDIEVLTTGEDGTTIEVAFPIVRLEGETTGDPSEKVMETTDGAAMAERAGRGS